MNGGIYAGVQYQVVDKQGKNYIALQAGDVAILMSQGANMHLLDDIGDQDPEDVMEALFDSIPKVK